MVIYTNVNPMNSMTSQMNTAQQPKQIGMIPQIIQKTIPVAQGYFNILKNAGIGVVTWFSIQEIRTRGVACQTLYNAFFNRDFFRCNKDEMKAVVDNLVAFYKSKGRVVQDFVNATAILDSQCPKKEYLHQLSCLFQQTVTEKSVSSLIYENMIPVVIGPALEEIFFGELLQKRVLEDLVKKVIHKVSPEYASLVDNKIYTSCRILLTALCFAVVMEMVKRGSTCDCLVDDEVKTALLGGIILGILRENFGLASTIVPRIIHNIVAIAPQILAQC